MKGLIARFNSSTTRNIYSSGNSSSYTVRLYDYIFFSPLVIHYPSNLKNNYLNSKATLWKNSILWVLHYITSLSVSLKSTVLAFSINWRLSNYYQVIITYKSIRPFFSKVFINYRLKKIKCLRMHFYPFLPYRILKIFTYFDNV